VPLLCDDLGELLDRSARGDISSFMDFYDLTIVDAHHLGGAAVRNRIGVGEAVRDAYVHAWLHGNAFRTSGLSARAWIMCLVRSSAHGNLIELPQAV
jgi:hypothetical protein